MVCKLIYSIKFANNYKLSFTNLLHIPRDVSLEIVITELFIKKNVEVGILGFDFRFLQLIFESHYMDRYLVCKLSFLDDVLRNKYSGND